METPGDTGDSLEEVGQEWNDPTNRYLRSEAMKDLFERFGPHPDPISIADRLHYYESHVYTGVCAMLDEFETRLFPRHLHSDLRAQLISACQLIAQLYPEQVKMRRRSRKEEKRNAKTYLGDIGDKTYLEDIRKRRRLRLWAVLGG